LILAIISGVLAIGGAFAGPWMVKANKKLAAIANIVKETSDVISKVSLALEDNKITAEEVVELQKELQDVKVAWKALFEKEVE